MDGRGERVVAAPPRVFALYRDSPQRREALASPLGAPERYCLFGLDELAADGWPALHNLEAGRSPRAAARTVGSLAGGVARLVGGPGGDFASVLAGRSGIAAADVVYSTVDTVGLPYVLLRRARLVPRTPFVYTSIGLLDRMARIRRAGVRRLYRDAVAAAGAVVAYGHAETDELRAWLGDAASPPAVHFVPFGVDTRWFRPSDRPADVDVAMVGADPQRDHELMLRVAGRTPQVAYRLVAADRAGLPAALPANVRLETALPFAQATEALARARVVALPVRDNAYSGATTTLLQALALAKPVVVSRTGAIAAGYGLADGETCRLVPPGDAEAFEHALLDLLADDEAAAALGRRGRALVEREHDWTRYVAAIRGVLLGVAGQDTA